MLLTGARLIAYMPTVVSIVHSRNSQQHSLWTWLIWVGANLTMAAWLYEDNGRRLNRAIVVNIGNALMCLVIFRPQGLLGDRKELAFHA